MILTLIFSLLFNVNASTVCSQETESMLLSLVNPKKSNFKDPVSVEWRLEDKNLLVQFDVGVPVQSGKKVFTPGKDYPFQYDVVEIFVAVDDPSSSNFDYYEFELTPNNQIYNVKINFTNGKKKFLGEFSVESEAVATSTSQDWTGTFKIPLDQLGWQGDVSFLRGNFFAIIGNKPNKTYWSTFLPPQPKADFHKPEYFKPLFKCQ